MIMQVLKQLLRHTINSTAAASMKEALQKPKQLAVVEPVAVTIMMLTIMKQRQIAVKMANAPKKDIMVKTVVRKMAKKWIAAKMVSAPKKATMVKTVAKNQSN